MPEAEWTREDERGAINRLIDAAWEQRPATADTADDPMWPYYLGEAAVRTLLAIERRLAELVDKRGFG